MSVESLVAAVVDRNLIYNHRAVSLLLNNGTATLVFISLTRFLNN